MIQTLLDSNTNIPADYDGACYIGASGDRVVGNCGDEFALNYNASSLSVSFNAGSKAIVGGSFFVVKEQESVLLPANSTVVLCCEVDNSKTNGNTGKFVALTTSQIKHENIFGNGTVHDLPLYQITTGTNGVISVNDYRVIVYEGMSIVSLTQDAFDRLPYKSPYVVYLTRE